MPTSETKALDSTSKGKEIATSINNEDKEASSKENIPTTVRQKSKSQGIGFFFFPKQKWIKETT